MTYSKLRLSKASCPKCGSDWDGGSILETFIKQRDEGVKCWKDMSDEQIEKKNERKLFSTILLE